MSKEETSVTVSGKAAWILNQGRKRMAQVIKNGFIDVATQEFLEQYRKNAESCAGSALTQREADTQAPSDTEA